jgi:hypothetical protein
MTDARLTALEEKLAKLAESSGGASITVQDPRVSSLTRWVFATLGTLAVGSIIWGVKSINDLNITVQSVVTQMAEESKRRDYQDRAYLAALEDHADRIKELERARATR